MGGTTGVALVEVYEINSQPVANAGQDQEGQTGQPVTLDGQGSSDADNDPLSFHWTLLTQPPGSMAELDDPLSEVSHFTPDLAGDYVAQIIVNDGMLDSDPDTVVIRVAPAMINVPDVVGLTQAQATTALTGAGLVLGTVTETHSDTVAAGLVISQLPTAATPVSPGSAVDLVISLGPGGGGQLPPDPKTVAPPIDPTVATNTYTATQFLYTGANPVQTGVAPGTIEPQRAAVIRGKVLDKQNNPQPGVTITILNHPEFGQTQSRADGMFDMAVNGGGYLTIDYRKTGVLPAQRQIHVPWQDYVMVEDAILIARDDLATTVDLSNTTEMQVARGNPVTDQSGTRQATLLIPPGTSAQVYNADGTTRPVTTLTVHATEYTVGDNGPKIMPAPLPPTSGYTYAVELSTDEGVIKKNGKDVLFNQPVPFYVDNFLDFPVGEAVPVGYYDNTKGAWIPSENGRIIKILSVDTGVAELDVTGSGQPASASELAALGITDAERERLAGLYGAGKSLWRVSLTHLSTWDCNWSIFPPGDAELPTPAKPESEDDRNPPACTSCPCPGGENTASGSKIGCESQSLGERIPLAGTSLSLNYSSDRSEGRISNRTLSIPLSGSMLPASLKRIDLTVEIAGRRFEQSFPPEPNQTTTFAWDGLDAYDRPVQGAQKVSIKVSNAYDGNYQRSERFGYNGNGIRIEGSRTRQEIYLVRNWTTRLGAFTDFQKAGIGSWSLDVHHLYDPNGQILYQGDGSRRGAQLPDSNVIDTVAGNGQTTHSGDGGLATNAGVGNAEGVAVGPDGSLYLAGGDRIRRVSPDGTITTIPASIGLSGAHRLAIGNDGSIFVSERFAHRVRRIGQDGIVTTIAGNGTDGYSGDGGPGSQAQLSTPYELAVAPDGTLYIADNGNSRIRRVGPDGVITTIAGGGTGGDGGPAIAARVPYPEGLALGPDGSLYVSSRFIPAALRRISPDGTITSVIPLSIFWQGLGLAVSQNSDLYISYFFGLGGYVFRVNPDGTRPIFAGIDTAGFSGDGGPAAQATFMSPFGLAVGQDGAVYIADSSNSRIRRVSEALPGFSAGEIVIGSDDGRVLYRFDAAGRHLSTIDTLTKAVLYTFAYDSEGRLVSITDANSNITTIERDASGAPTAIVAPFGQRTTLTVNENGNLASVSDPAGEKYTLSYAAGGLLTGFTNPKGNTSRIAYDALGRLQRDENAAGGSQTITRHTEGKGYAVTRATALNRTTTYSLTDLPSGDRQRKVRAPNGTETVTLLGANGSAKVTAPDGTVTETLDGPDPRFGMQSPITTSSTITSGGLTLTASADRTAVLAVPRDVLSLTQLTDTVTLNGRTATSVYNAATRVATATSAAGRVGTTTLDNLGRVIQSQVTGLLAVNTVYDARGRLASVIQGSGADERTLAFAYNPLGQLHTVTDPLGRTVSYEYDLAGRVIRQTLPDGRDIFYTFDANGNLASLTPPGRPAHAFKYTSIDQTQEYVPPDVGAGSNSTLYEYDLDKALTRITRPDGLAIGFGYDSAGRLNRQTVPEGDTTYAYDATTGKLTTVTAPDGGTLGFTYNGALLTQTAWTGAIAGNVGFTYDNDFRVTGVRINGVDTISYQYDADSLLTQVGDLNLSRNSQNGLLTGTTLGAVNDSLSYNGFGEVTQRDAKVNGASFFKTDYTYDKLGRITRKVESFGVVANTHDYGYDQAGRLVEVKLNGATTSTYNYDANGNRLSRTQGGTPIAGTYDDQDRLLTYGGAAYTYTANGELKTKTLGGQTTSYDYDVLGNLRKVILPASDGRTLEYVIDAANRRVGKKVNGTLVQGFLYQDQLKPIAELDGNGNIVSRFVYATRANVPDYMVKGGVAYRIVTDHLGSPRFVVNVADGSVAQQMDYDEFGNLIGDTAPGFQPFGFAGGLYDRDTKLVRFGARDYEAETGRWVVKDFLNFRGLDTNLFSYVNNNPETFTDVLGLLIDIFVFGSRTEEWPWGWLHPAAENIAILGWSSEKGFYSAHVAAVGFHIGGEANSFGAFRGKEYSSTGNEGITIIEGNIGLEALSAELNGGAGSYQLDSGETGGFFDIGGGALGQRGAAGFGFSTPNLIDLVPSYIPNLMTNNKYPTALASSLNNGQSGGAQCR